MYSKYNNGFGARLKKKKRPVDQIEFRYRATHIWSCDLQQSKVKKNDLFQEM